jgi:LysR family transcriptional activator of nhaA
MRGSEDLNYHHLLYFWVVAGEGSISAASRRLHVSQPTISMQLEKLQRSLGRRLFQKSGRGLALTEQGEELLRYAEPIFVAGKQLADHLAGRAAEELPKLVVGVPDTMPKLVSFRLIEPALRMIEPVRIVCYEGKLDELLSGLAVHRFDVILSSTPVGEASRVRAYNHLLGDCGLSFFGATSLARKLQKGFPASLNGAPMIMPTENTELRRAMDHWFAQNEVRPRVLGEFEDSALLKEVGQSGVAVFPSASAIEAEIRRQYRVQVVGRANNLRQRFFAISGERKLSHPAVRAILMNARRDLFV